MVKPLSANLDDFVEGVSREGRQGTARAGDVILSKSVPHVQQPSVGMPSSILR